MADLAQGRVGANRIQHRRHQVLVVARRLTQPCQHLLDGRAVPASLQVGEPLFLRRSGFLSDPENLHRHLVALDEVVHADDDPPPRVHLLLEAARRVGDLSLEVPRLDPRDDASQGVDLLEDRLRLLLHLVGQALHVVGAGERVDRVGHAGLVGEDLLGAEGDPDRVLRRQGERLVHRVRVQGLGAAEHGRHPLVRDADDVVVGLLGGQGHAGRLRVSAQPPARGALRPVHVAQVPGPDAPSRPELGDLLEEVVVDVPEEGETGREGIHVQAAADPLLHVREPVLEGEGELLRRGRPRLPYVVAGDGDRVEAGRVLARPLEGVGDDLQRGTWREDPRMLRHVLLEDVVLDRPSDLLERYSLLLSGDEQEAVEHHRRPIDRHGDGHLVQRDSVEQRLHVGEARDGDPALPHLTRRERVIGVVAHERREVERYRKTGLPALQEELVTLVGILRRGEAGEEPHGPQPRAVHAGVGAASERVLAGQAEIAQIIVVGGVQGRVQRADGRSGYGREVRVGTERTAAVRLLPASQALLEAAQLGAAARDLALQLRLRSVGENATHPISYRRLRSGVPARTGLRSALRRRKRALLVVIRVPIQALSHPIGRHAAGQQLLQELALDRPPGAQG